MQVLLVSDLHYDLRKLDWLLDQAAEQDVLVLAGDLLDIASTVPLDAQIAVLLEYLSRMAGRTQVIVCSGNHDLDSRDDSGEKSTRWLDEGRALGVTVDGDSLRLDGWLLTACAWWEGPTTLAALEARLAAAAGLRTDRWLWVWHGPPDGPLSWTGATSYGDPELPRLVEEHRPDIVLCGHIHQAPYTDTGSWHTRQDATWLFNPGHQRGPVPSHIRLDLERGRAQWWSYAGSDAVDLTQAAQ
jgi:predicted phosphodiesterase